MNTPLAVLVCGLATASLTAQTITIFPDEYAAVPEGPSNSPNLPLARGTSRVQCLYEAIDLAIPSGQQITKLGFRQDAATTTIDVGQTLQLEIRMGYSSLNAVTMGTTFASNYVAPPVTVFGPAAFTLPNLRDAANPLANGRFFITLTTPFTYTPATGNLVVEYLVYGTSGGGTTFNYRLDRGDYYSPVTYGVPGCPRSGGGIPNLTAQPVRPGLSYSTSCTLGPGSSFAILLIVPGGTIQPPYSLQSMVTGIQPTCFGQVSLAGVQLLTGVTGTTGSISWSFVLPNNPAWADFNWASQAVFFDFFAPGGVIVSNGAHVLTGALPRTTILAGNGPPATTTTGTANRNYNPVAFFEHQ